MSKRPAADTQGNPAAKKGKLWGGRFSGKTDPLFEAFNASISFDKHLWKADLKGSIAYAKANARSGLLTEAERDQLVAGLEQVYTEWETGAFKINPDTDEDIHTANERRLTEIVGALGGKLHTGRSRNDQVATDLRLWVMEEVKALKQLLTELLACAADKAEEGLDILMPGFTHLQPAQPVRLSHWIMSHAWAWERDLQRLCDLEKRVKVLPLGSGALAGNAFGLDRDFLAKELGFDSISPNSMDAVCNRDFVAEMLFWAAMTSIHISQCAEDLIIYSAKKLVCCADAYSTGSSLMPQKKNPDALELLRGKTGRVVGGLTSMLVLLKGLPRAYNKDLQEDKEALFDACRTMRGAIPICTGVLATLKWNPEKMLADLSPEMLATDLAEYLVRKGVPFRETHHVAGAAVQLAESRGKPMNTLTVEDLKGLHPQFGDDIGDIWDYGRSADSRNTPGGSSRCSSVRQIKDMSAILSKF